MTGNLAQPLKTLFAHLRRENRHAVALQHNIDKARENNIIIPTFAQMQNPETIPEKIQEKLKGVGLWDVNPLNLFRIAYI